MMQVQAPIQKPILIYFKIRGNAQIIRSVLLQIGVQFQEVFVTKKGYLDPNLIKNYNLELQKLPYLIHNGSAFNDVFPILKYLCLYYNRGDLLGKSVQDIVRITQILVKYSKQRNVIMSALLQGMTQIQQKNSGEKGVLRLAQVLTQIFQKNKYFQVAQKMYSKTGSYLCGYLTILDFIFYEKCFYFVNMLTVKDQTKGEMKRQYVRFFQNTEFYRKNKQFLEEYKIFVHQVDSNMNILLQKMWVGDKKYLINL